MTTGQENKDEREKVKGRSRIIKTGMGIGIGWLLKSDTDKKSRNQTA